MQMRGGEVEREGVPMEEEMQSSFSTHCTYLCFFLISGLRLSSQVHLVIGTYQQMFNASGAQAPPQQQHVNQSNSDSSSGAGKSSMKIEPRDIASKFVLKYYKTLGQSPEHAHHFYR